MRRYLYSNLLKIIFGSLLIITFIPSLVFFVCSLLIDKSINITSLVIHKIYINGNNLSVTCYL